MEAGWVGGVSGSGASVESFDAEDLADEWPPAHYVCDINRHRRFAHVPKLVCRRPGRGEVVVFV